VEVLMAMSIFECWSAMKNETTNVNYKMTAAANCKTITLITNFLLPTALWAIHAQFHDYIMYAKKNVHATLAFNKGDIPMQVKSAITSHEKLFKRSRWAHLLKDYIGKDLRWIIAGIILTVDLTWIGIYGNVVFMTQDECVADGLSMGAPAVTAFGVNFILTMVSNDCVSGGSAKYLSHRLFYTVYVDSGMTLE